MVYLLGVSHSIQLFAALPFRDGGLDNAGSCHIAADLEAHVNGLVDKHLICTIAEEYSAECSCSNLQVDERAYLLARRVCERRQDLEHAFVDPNRAEREFLYAAAAGLSEKEDEIRGIPIREGEWLSRLQAYLPRVNLLFVGDANNISSFSWRLTQERIPSEIVCEDFQARFTGSRPASCRE